MTHGLTFFLVISYTLMFFSLYKYLIIKQKIKNMHQVNAICTDVIVRRTYNKKYYLYCYTFKFHNEEYSLTDKLRLPLFQKRIMIQEKYPMYVNRNNPQEYLTPVAIITYKWYLYGAIFLFILSFFSFI